MSRSPKSLVFILTDEEGFVQWNSRRLHAYVAYGTFLEGGAHGISLRKEEINRAGSLHADGLRLVFQESLTEKIRRSGAEQAFNPNIARELRKEGMLPGGRFGGVLPFYRDEALGTSGFVLWQRDGYLRYIDEAGISYRVLLKEQ